MADPNNEQLRISEIRYRRLFETAKDGILILDANSAKITDANPFIGDLLGFSHDELLGKELWQIGVFKDIEASKNAVRELQEKQYIRYEDLPLQTKDGRGIHVEFISNVYNEGDQYVIQCNIRDITERKRLDNELRKHAADMMESDKRKDEFLAMLSHELRNPLAPIRNGLQVLRLAKGNNNGVAEQAMDIMEKQTVHLTRLVDDLLDVSRITRGKIELRKEVIELEAAMYHAAETIRPLSDACQHNLTILPPSISIMISADPTRLEQIFINLLNNAVKYTQVGGHISMTADQEGDEIVIRVRDTGMGISAESLPFIFDLFNQVHRTLDHAQG